METHFTRGRVCRRALIVQGYHLNHAVVNDRRRAARSGADDAIPSSAGKPETLNPSKSRVLEKVRFRDESAIVAVPQRDGWFGDKAKLVRATWTVQTCAALSKYIYIEGVGELHGVLAANVDKVSPGGGGACLRRSKNAESARRTVPPKTYYRNSFSDDQTDARPWRATGASGPT